MTDITHPKLIILKGFLFLLAGVLASGLLLVLHPEWTVAFLLGVAVWSFARFYYFAFYVIQHYVDPSYKFSGLTSCMLYLLRRGRSADA
jgi:type IV secretory pathway TrbD component